MRGRSPDGVYGESADASQEPSSRLRARTVMVAV